MTCHTTNQLDAYQKQYDSEELFNEAVDRRVKELMLSGGEYDPFSTSNGMEAIGSFDEDQNFLLIAFYESVYDTSETPAGPPKWIYDYWHKKAEQQAIKELKR